jgi:hypothetical protein
MRWAILQFSEHENWDQVMVDAVERSRRSGAKSRNAINPKIP